MREGGEGERGSRRMEWKEERGGRKRKKRRGRRRREEVEGGGRIRSRKKWRGREGVEKMVEDLWKGE